MEFTLKMNLDEGLLVRQMLQDRKAQMESEQLKSQADGLSKEWKEEYTLIERLLARMK